MSLYFCFKIISLVLLASAGGAAPLVSANASKYAPSTPDSGVRNLIALEYQARQIALKSQGEIFRQVDTDLQTTDFRFIDRALTKEVTIVIPEQNSPVEKWNTVVNPVSPLLSYPSPDLELHTLNIGAGRVAQAATDRWNGCGIRGMTLYLEKEKLTWLVFCNTPSGVVSGSMDNETGVFRPENSPPASLPGAATREP
jgi:hypothetical protein